MQVSGKLYAPLVFPRERTPWYPLNESLFGHQSPSRRFWRKAIFLALTRNLTAIPWSSSTWPSKTTFVREMEDIIDRGINSHDSSPVMTLDRKLGSCLTAFAARCTVSLVIVQETRREIC